MTDDAAHRRETSRDGPVPSAPCSALIIAGGRSRRMGRPKPWLPLGGVPMLVRVAACVRPLVAEIVVISAVDQELPPVEARVLHDRTPDLGPLPALALGLAAVTTPYAFALGCDTPLVRRALLEQLLRTCHQTDAPAVIPLWDGRVQPLVAVYHHRLARVVAAMGARGERRLAAIADLPGVHLVQPDELRACDPEGVSFRALNTPAEYADAVRTWTHTATSGNSS